MLRVYMLIIVVGLIGGVVYGAYAYYNDTQQRIKTLQENNAKLETVAKANEMTINSLQESQEKFATLNNELQTKLNLALNYGDDLRKKLHKHDLTRLSIKKPGLIEKRINDGTNKYLTVSSLLLLTLLLSSCGYLRKPEKEIVVKTVEVQKIVPIQPQPKPVDMIDVKFYVVTEENYEEFKEKFMKTNNDYVFYAVSVHDYENLAFNMAELYRYIRQQKEIIIYYEKAVEVKPEEKVE